ncbi:MAG: UDP-3-O-acyl-N-acetylglucosamine deacetylase, partial [Muribaculaceae bacterium]|nr:UDP-3-O-acyl-N-acetylglucosamine deacetylase [Muribaculaceae bacterium]
MNQVTLKDSFSITGKGLHTGLEITAEFCPAEVGQGYKFQRVDLEDQPIIDALAENVVETQRGTVLAKGDAKVSTVEHALAALYAAGIDNVLIKVNGPEVPILDGSAIEYCRKIEEVGTVEQDADKDFYIVKQRIEVVDEKTGASILVLPDTDFAVDVRISYDSSVIPNQFASLDNVADFATEIASSRTFVFVREIEPLVKNNLIKGGDLDNAIVIYDQPMAQADLDHLADMMGVEHKPADQLGYVNHRPLAYD